MLDDEDALVELVQALERFPSLFSLNRDAVALYDRGGTIVTGNGVARALVGASGHELRGTHFSRHMASAEVGRAAARFELALSGEPVEFESRFARLDGEAVDVIVRLTPAIVAAKIVGVFGIARDVTQQRRAEDERDESRREFLSLFEQHPDPISMIDANGRYVRVNAAAERLLGCRSEEMAGKEVASMLPPGEQDELNGFIQDMIRAGKPTRYRQTLPNGGAPMTVEGTAIPIVFEECVKGLFLMSRDVTDREQRDEALACQSLRMRRLYRLASEIGADANEQVDTAIAFGLKELELESAVVVAIHEQTLTIERRAGAELCAGAEDPLFRRLIGETIAESGLREIHGPALKKRSGGAPRTRPFCRTFVGIALDVESGRYGALAFVSGNRSAPLSDLDREFVRAVGELVAVNTERAIQERRLNGLAHFDALTGLPNRLLLHDRFAQAIAAAPRRDENVAVYFVDLDRFKTINDTYGHLVGDEVLKVVAQRLRRACRDSDTVARLAGDEFIVLRPGPAIGAPPRRSRPGLKRNLRPPARSRACTSTSARASVSASARRTAVTNGPSSSAPTSRSTPPKRVVWARAGDTASRRLRAPVPQRASSAGAGT